MKRDCTLGDVDPRTLREIMNQVREGTLDFILIKPVSAQFMATFRTLNIWRIANVGGYAIQPIWGDGHASGIYSFDYLRKVAEASGNAAD